jgi:hypothetical protein
MVQSRMLAENCVSFKPLPDVELLLQHVMKQIYVTERFYAADE